MSMSYGIEYLRNHSTQDLVNSLVRRNRWPLATLGDATFQVATADVWYDCEGRYAVVEVGCQAGPVIQVSVVADIRNEESQRQVWDLMEVKGLLLLRDPLMQLPPDFVIESLAIERVSSPVAESVGTAKYYESKDPNRGPVWRRAAIRPIDYSQAFSPKGIQEGNATA